MQAAGPVKIKSALVCAESSSKCSFLEVSFSRSVQAFDIGLYDVAGSFIERISEIVLAENDRVSSIFGSTRFIEWSVLIKA